MGNRPRSLLSNELRSHGSERTTSQVRSVLRFCWMLSLTFQTHAFTWISGVRSKGHWASQGSWTLLFSFVSHTLVPNGQPMLKQGLLWCCCWCCCCCCFCLPSPLLLLLLSLLPWFSVMHVCHYVVRLSTRYMCGYSHTGFAALAPMIRLLFMGFIKNKKHQM